MVLNSIIYRYSWCFPTPLCVGYHDVAFVLVFCGVLVFDQMLALYYSCSWHPSYPRPMLDICNWRTDHLCYCHILCGSGVEQTTCALCVKVLMPFYFVDMSWWLSQHVYIGRCVLVFCISNWQCFILFQIDQCFYEWHSSTVKLMEVFMVSMCSGNLSICAVLQIIKVVSTYLFHVVGGLPPLLNSLMNSLASMDLTGKSMTTPSISSWDLPEKKKDILKQNCSKVVMWYTNMYVLFDSSWSFFWSVLDNPNCWLYRCRVVTGLIYHKMLYRLLPMWCSLCIYVQSTMSSTLWHIVHGWFAPHQKHIEYSNSISSQFFSCKYPTWALDRMDVRNMNNKGPTSDQKKNTTEHKNKSYIMITYTHRCWKASRISVNNGIENHFKSGRTLKKILVALKDKDIIAQKSRVLFSFRCDSMDCDHENVCTWRHHPHSWPQATQLQ